VCLSPDERLNLIRAARKLYKETGKSVGDYLMDTIKGGDQRYRATAIKIFFDNTIAKKTESTSEVTKTNIDHKVIAMPKRKDDPAEAAELKAV